MTTVLISGLGLIGSSIARVIHRQNPADEMIGVDPDDDSSQFMLQQHIINRIDTFNHAAQKADVIILAGPVSVIISQIKELANIKLKPNVLITDTGSTKASVMKAAQSLIKKGVGFLGGHPMAGSHLTGSRSGSLKLLTQSTYFLVNGSQTQRQLDQFKALMKPAKINWTLIGAKDHDQLVSELSHVPHVVATTLVNAAVAQLQDNPTGLSAAAGGFKDTTRIAAADPTMWTAIMLNNADAIDEGIEAFKTQLTKLQTAIHNQDEQTILRTFQQAQAIRESLDK